MLQRHGHDGCSVHHHLHQEGPCIKGDAAALRKAKRPIVLGLKENRKHDQSIWNLNFIKISLLARDQRIAIPTTATEKINLVRAVYLTSQEHWFASTIGPSMLKGQPLVFYLLVLRTREKTYT